jgi:hypothetical protein
MNLKFGCVRSDTPVVSFRPIGVENLRILMSQFEAKELLPVLALWLQVPEKRLIFRIFLLGPEIGGWANMGQIRQDHDADRGEERQSGEPGRSVGRNMIFTLFEKGIGREKMRSSIVRAMALMLGFATGLAVFPPPESVWAQKNIVAVSEMAPLLGNGNDIYAQDINEMALFLPATRRIQSWEKNGHPLERIRERGQLAFKARTQTYGILEPHPLIASAADILSSALRPYADKVYVTSMARSPEDQRRLMSHEQYREWTSHRSKHLMGGLAVDIGFVKPYVNMMSMYARAESILRWRLPFSKNAKLRVVAEANCLHIEIDTIQGREIIEERRQIMERLGILDPKVRRHPVPLLREYAAERIWLSRPRDLLVPLPY